jgi:beta-xylosidase
MLKSTQVISSLLLMAIFVPGYAQQKSQHTLPQYQNPIIHADFSDPDVIAVGEDFYMVASSFNAVPGLPVLHSKDLVHWTIITHALPRLVPEDSFLMPQHGKGVWAPSIRFYKGEFYIFYPDPDFGIYLTKAKGITGPWSAPVLVEAGKGLIDPCPLWDDDGRVYLAHAYAGSRAGFKSIIVIKELNAAANKVISDGVLVYDGHAIDATIEGPKMYKRNGYYYVFAPAGGVSTGWQTVLRSKNIYGPYERKVVLQQGNSSVNGPHQGAWVHTQQGEDWFIHFQDKDAYGRIIHLQPMVWKNDWPVMGTDKDGDGAGEPVLQYRMPWVTKKNKAVMVQDSDDFNSHRLGLQWQWHANPQSHWAFCNPSQGALRLNSVLQSAPIKNLWEVPNLLLQKFPAEKFTVAVKASFTAKTEGERFGLLLMGLDYAYISLVKRGGAVHLAYADCSNADKGNGEAEHVITTIYTALIYFKITVEQGAVCSFSYSTDGVSFTAVKEKFIAKPGKWIGAKFGLFCTRSAITNDAGYADIDWVKVVK